MNWDTTNIHLKAGDCLLYDSPDLVDFLIHFSGGTDVAHVEIYLGQGKSFASRNGIGVNVFEWRTAGLKYVLRPVQPLDMDAAALWTTQVCGEGYDWLGLAGFIGLPLHEPHHLFCSAAATLWYRQAKLPIFSKIIPAGKISPYNFRMSPALAQVWPEPPLAASDES